MAHHQHTLSKQLVADALGRFTSTGDVYNHTVEDFRPMLLKAIDAQIIVSGAVLEEVMRSNGNGRRQLRDRARSAALPVLGGGSLATLAGLRLVEFLVGG
tara:strand:- start:41 stop:340 length:300 start_codon:yes stop_codon:yes gene_type:complete